MEAGRLAHLDVACAYSALLTELHACCMLLSCIMHLNACMLCGCACSLNAVRLEGAYENNQNIQLVLTHIDSYIDTYIDTDTYICTSMGYTTCTHHEHPSGAPHTSGLHICHAPLWHPPARAPSGIPLTLLSCLTAVLQVLELCEGGPLLSRWGPGEGGCEG